MKYLSQKEITKLAEAQDKKTDDFKGLLDKYYARYRLQIISETELFALLDIKK
jgi:hypothetical protein